MKKNHDSIIKGALILTIAGLITKVLGFIYRIYMSNLIGAEGMGLYQLVFPVFMICYTVCCSGIFTSISKLVAEQKAKKHYRNMTRVVTCATSISFCLAMVLSIILFIFANYISTYLLKEPRTFLSLRILAVFMPFTAICSCMKGFFYGQKKALVPAMSQIIEQVTRIIIVYIITAPFVSKGLDYACAMAIIGVGVGEILSFFYVIISYKISLSKKINYKKKYYSRYKVVFRKICAIAIPLTTNRVLVTILSSVETILIPIMLQKYGLSKSESLSIFGILTGMVLPLIFFPSVFTNSLSMMLLPSVSEAQASDNSASIDNTSSKTLQYSLLIGIISTAIFLVFGNSLGFKIYNNTNVGPLLTTIAWLCPFLYINTTLSSILNGLDHQIITLRNNCIGLTIRILFIVFIIPIVGLQGFLWGLLISQLLVALLNIKKILNITTINFDVNNWLLKPILISTALSLTLSYIYYNYIINISSSIILLLIICLLFAVGYIILLFTLNCIPKNDLRKVKRSI